MNKINQAIANRKRRQYLAGFYSHNEYYLWLAEFIGITQVKNLPTKVVCYDCFDPFVRQFASAKGIMWSRCETTCVLKAIGL